MFAANNERLVYRYEAETLWIEAWGKDALRIRATRLNVMPDQLWGLENPEPQTEPVKPSIVLGANEASITNGGITATVTASGWVLIRKANGQIILSECNRVKDMNIRGSSSLNFQAREFKPNHPGSSTSHVKLRLDSICGDEQIYGMGQYQLAAMDLKGADLELAHRNSQASIPFFVSSLGYGFLWNNPAVGRAVLGTNIMTFEAYSTTTLDYWICSGPSPAAIQKSFARATHSIPPPMPDYGLSLWQSKLRYQTQDEVLSVAREYHKRNISVGVLVIDFFHWDLQGTWDFDPTFWPTPQAMIEELKSYGIEVMVSIWPTVDKRSPLYPSMLENGFLVRVGSGVKSTLWFYGDTIFWDATNPDARKYLWEKCKKNYYDLGVRVFWLDEAEPEYDSYDFENYYYWAGSNLEVGNLYPREYARTFYEGMKAAGQDHIVNLVRCAWVGSAKYGALVWSGDIASSWESFRAQLCIGLSMGLCGVPWWTTDIGGFHHGESADQGFRELLIRWFQWGAFCPVMRLHGNREPMQDQLGNSGGSVCCSGAPNEIWSFGEEVESILLKYLEIRDMLKDYIKGLMEICQQ
ncbi:hypothetical protein LTR10_023925 [Elasticomyces elasticus]|uniref:Glycoside hydrolase family 31 protein n=1 Tax=Exophiala sideris TaxID=1016849 RepID=A0ABR0J852_9EURO|nr:hypothetical protein LTR10_023925 [Elasticomyces elasticus]KAK5025532.1 hypothetical protein LTR13_010371 [Exophiala sideris]KAK5029804.1 hypothetical protein LTS07_005528 [Exophiala sideris]KAK5058434.1 hypothetical protein LTR69_006839 [Exophiala sideris]KAK5178593.1 hypothetical protein LTR44_008964 [Eurotiomycetes sp. CCFEE 6388]